MARLFVGTFLSPEQQEKLGRLKSEHERLSGLWKRKLRWVKPAKLHLTWFFLGDVEEGSVERVSAELAYALAGQSGTEVNYEQAEFWPSDRKARQLVLTPQVVPDQVQTLVAAIRNKMTPLVGEPDYKTFKPHITLLRFDSKDSPREVRKEKLSIPDWMPLSTVLPVKHRIAEVSLIRSHLGQTADDYERLVTLPLG